MYVAKYVLRRCTQKQKYTLQLSQYHSHLRKGFISSSSKHLSRYALITECLKSRIQEQCIEELWNITASFVAWQCLRERGNEINTYLLSYFQLHSNRAKGECRFVSRCAFRRTWSHSRSLSSSLFPFLVLNGDDTCLLIPLSTKTKVMNYPSCAVLAFFALLKHPSSAVIAFVQRMTGRYYIR